MSLILRDFECADCEFIEEHYVKPNVFIVKCTKCGAEAHSIISVGQVYNGNQDATWIKSVTEIVEKGSGKPHCEEFLKNPTRENYRNWMRGEGLRPFEPGEKPTKPTLPDPDKMNKQLFERHRKRNALEVR